MAGRSGDGVELNVFVLRRAVHDSIEESLEQGKLEFRDAKSGSVSSVGEGGKYGREVGWGRGQETEENAAVRAEGGGDMAVESERAAAPEEGIFTAIFSTTYPQIPCPNL